jgi:class 3 adenylate cyclase
MPATNALILIPDISGFTHFMSSMELEHASHLISSFLETIVNAAEDKFEVSEIEGDAVLLYKKDGFATKQELLDQ